MRKKDKPAGPSKKLTSIDGIVSDGRQLGVVPKRPKKAAKTDPGDSLENFAARPDGFHPLRQSPAGLGGSAAVAYEALDEPIIIDDESRDTKAKASGFRLKNVSKRQLLKHSSLALAAFLLVGAIYFGVKFFITYRQVLQGGGNAPALAADIDISQLKGEGDGRVNILLLGIGGPNHEAPDLTDTILLASIDPINHKTALLSVPRDLWVQIPDDGYQKVNAAYSFGKTASTTKSGKQRIRNGLKHLDRTLEPILDVPIHYHVIVNFGAFKQAVNAVGGVTVNVPEQLYDPTIAWENNYNPLIAKKGSQKFNGQKALLYVKSRQTSTDFARSERQRLVLVALKDKVLSAGTFSNPIRVSQLLNSFGSNVFTDFSLDDLSRLYQIISEIPSAGIKSLDLVTPPHQLLTTGNINGLSIVQPTAGLFNYSAIQRFVHSRLKDGLIVKENAAVMIYNATSTPGLATKQAKILRSFGYRVVTVANAPKTTNPATTAVVDLTDGAARYTRNYLEKRFKTAAQSNLPDSSGIAKPNDPAFVIILGKDATANSR